MSKAYMEMTFRDGKPFAAYLYLDRRSDDVVDRTKRMGSVLADLAKDGRVMGIEIPSPATTRAGDLLSTLASLHVHDIREEELALLPA